MDIPANTATIPKVSGPLARFQQRATALATIETPPATEREGKDRTLKHHIRRLLGRGARLDPDAPLPSKPPRPVLWLLGKTGAGKSSLVQALTGQAEIGSGFAPCTRTAQAFDFPADHPVMRFLDTRGLGEVGYDPGEDLRTAEAGSHAVIAVARLDDPVQGPLADVLAELRRRRPKLPILLVHTGADLLGDTGKCDRARAATTERLERAAGGGLPAVTMALPPGQQAEGLDDLRAALAQMVPDLALMMMEERAADTETASFASHRALVLWYAGAAGATDAAPLIGTVSVPALQGAMLHALAARYGLKWTAARAGGFATALGSGIALRLALGHGLRQGAKLVPVVGQTLGAAAAAATSFAATYALGRAAALWLYRSRHGTPPDSDELRAVFTRAFQRARDVSG